MYACYAVQRKMLANKKPESDAKRPNPDELYGKALASAGFTISTLADFSMANLGTVHARAECTWCLYTTTYVTTGLLLHVRCVRLCTAHVTLAPHRTAPRTAPQSKAG